jgi:hypothetical protein
MMYVIEMGSADVIFIQSFIKIFSRHSEVNREGFTGTQHGDLIILLLFYFFRNKENSLKTSSSTCTELEAGGNVRRC